MRSNRCAACAVIGVMQCVCVSRVGCFVLLLIITLPGYTVCSLQHFFGLFGVLQEGGCFLLLLIMTLAGLEYLVCAQSRVYPQ